MILPVSFNYKHACLPPAFSYFSIIVHVIGGAKVRLLQPMYRAFDGAPVLAIGVCIKYVCLQYVCLSNSEIVFNCNHCAVSCSQVYFLLVYGYVLTKKSDNSERGQPWVNPVVAVATRGGESTWLQAALGNGALEAS